ncbi:50S ribosomal protein L7/L12 [Candidatus Curtissbacteria bacterium]|nr:50S ribosomal protein L7/L12 [Candidatus Curtissbacteria bacterium]
MADQEEVKTEDQPKAGRPLDEKTATTENRSKSVKSAVAVSLVVTKLIEQIEKLTVIELSGLVKALEEKFGVSAAPTVVAGATALAPTGAGADEGVSEQTTFNVILADSGANKISVIKALREIVPTLGLKEAKDIADAPPKPILEGVNKTAASEAKTKLEAAGAKVELK